MDVFRSFPRAINSRDWEIGHGKIGDIAGNSFTKISRLDVIIDEGANVGLSENPAGLGSDVLIYCRPEQLPTLKPAKLMSGFVIRDRSENDYYAITDVGIGRNQETGRIEHVELKLTQTEVYDE